MSKVKIDREDAHRVLLTELLPYEVPILFSNDGFYQIVSKGKFDYFEKKINTIKHNTEYGIPFNFEIRKSTAGDTRLLSVIHPFNQIRFIDFYKKYDSLIIHQCSKSPFSLRRVSKIAKFCYSPSLVFEEDGLKNQEVEVEPDILDRETKILKSYFTYQPIDLIYKFYERNEYRRLEQRYNNLLEFDITKCFYNIYTHSITWAVKDKESAKRNAKKESFENRFDKLMQQANYNETNGIVVGPEVSRIFAEIILQQIDVNTLLYLESKGIKHGVDYEVRRYVDDYFIFTNNKNHTEIIFKAFKKELKEFKLYVNDSKTNNKTTPFITDHAVGKIELKKVLSDLFNQLIIEVDTPEGNGKQRKIIDIKKPYSFSQDLIKDFQCIVKRNNLTYDSLSKEIVRYSKGIVVKVFRNKELSENVDNIENLLLVILDICFYAYSLNITSSVTFKLSQLLVLISKYLSDKPAHIKHNICSKISREVDFVMTVFQRKTKKDETNIETLNLLLSIKEFDKTYSLSEKKIQELFSLDSSEAYDKLNYFHFVTLLYYIEDDISYLNLKSALLESVKKRFESESHHFTKAEFTMLFFDIMTCPYINDDFKRKIMIISKYAKDKNSFQTELKKIQEHKQWFMDWDKNIDLEGILKKKEWGSTY